MVPSYQRDSIRVSDLEAEEEHEALEGIEAAIDKVAHEEVVGVGNIASHTEELHQIVELAMYIAAYCDGRVDLHDVGLFYEEFAGFVAYLADLGFGDDAASAEFSDGSMDGTNESASEGWSRSGS